MSKHLPTGGESRADSDRPLDPAAGRDAQLAELRRAVHRRDLAGTRHRMAVARRLGIGDTAMQVVAHIAQRGRLTPSQLGELVDLSSGGISALIARLESAGHVRREPHPNDGRSTLIGLSPSVVEHASVVYSPLIQRLQAIGKAVEPDHLPSLIAYLRAVADATEHESDRLTALAVAERNPRHLAPDLWG